MTTIKTRIVAIAALMIPAAACGPPAGVLPHEDSAAGHRRRASAEEQKAAAYPTGTSAKANLYYGAQRDKRLRLAYAHLGAAQSLEDAYIEQCVERGFTSLPPWPAITDVRESRQGVTLRLENPVEALAQLRCRRAAMARDGFGNFPHDPLALPRVELGAGADTGTIVLTTTVEGPQVSDLRDRAGTLARR
jgi:hypothetical protein